MRGVARVQQSDCPHGASARTSFFDLLAGIIDATCNIVFLPNPTWTSSASNESVHLVAIWAGPIVLKTSESIWRYPVFAFICYVSIHLEISATVVRSAPEELPKHRRKGHNRQHDRSSRSHHNRCRCSDAVDDTRPALRGQRVAFLVGRESSHQVLPR